MIRANRKGFGNDGFCTTLIHCGESGAGGPGTFDESSFGGDSGAGHTCTLVDNAPFSPALTVSSKFGRYAWRFSTASTKYSYIQVGSALHADWTFLEQDYTIDLWINAKLAPLLDWGVDAYVSIAGLFVDVNNYNCLILFYDQATTKHQVRYYIAETGSDVVHLSCDIDVVDEAYHHIAVNRNDNAYTLIVDGVMGDKGTYGSSLATLNTTFYFGNVGSNSAESYLEYMILDEMRLSTGVRRWEKNVSAGSLVFVPPNRAY